jgi:hypothetical protein
MAHYAFLNKKNVVTEVIVGVDENELIEGLSPEEWYGKFRKQVCKRTSYNGSIRKNYASIGSIYNEELDAFIWPKPFDSWILNKDTCQWEAPIPNPANGLDFFWNETELDWKPRTPSEPKE